MIYRSNLNAPDLQPFFRHTISRPMPHSRGHDVISDREHFPDCGFFTHDEAAILYHIASQLWGTWLDIGGHTGWTAAHLAAASDAVVAVDPMYADHKFRARTEENLANVNVLEDVSLFAGTSEEFFDTVERKQFCGVVIDGDHEPPAPLNDAIGAERLLLTPGAVVIHDFSASPTWKAAKYLIDCGFRFRVYNTPHMLCVCWRGAFEPPNHQPDPRLDFVNARRQMAQMLPLEKEA